MKRLLTAVVVVVMLTVLLGVTGSPAPASAEPAPDSADSSADVVAPIIVLLDTSDSMNEDDGSGVLKLAGAKRAVRNIVRELSSTTVFGLSTYPSPDGCTGGGFVVPPGPLTDSGNVLEKVDAIQADGGTPTGPALRTLADDLTTRGYTSATIVLISDGLSTCGEPPCDVAKQLVSEGFDVTVPTIGFRTTEEGSEELSCVAAATGAATFNAGDSEQLAEQLKALLSARLSITVRYDTEPMSGSSTRITAVVTHEGGENAQDVRIAITFADADNPNARRAGIPPIISVGAVPAGTPAERTWVVGTGPRGDSVTTAFTVSAWGANAARVSQSGEYTPTEPEYIQSELGDIFAGVSKETPLIVFGDSYSSGEGTGPYERTIQEVSPLCHRSYKTYLGRIFTPAEMKIVACSGAQTWALGGPGERSTISQIHEMNSFGFVPGAGVMTFGGNDIGFKDVIVTCVSPTKNCGSDAYRASKVTDARNVESKLGDTYMLAWAAMNTPELREKRGGAYAPLVVLPYPSITHEIWRGSCGKLIDANETKTADDLVSNLNRSVALAVKKVQSRGYGVHFAEGVDLAFRPDHTVCAASGSYVNGIIWTGVSAASESFHPNEAGYTAETDALIRWAGAATDHTPDVTDAEIAAMVGEQLTPVELLWPPFVDLDKQLEPLTVPQGGAVKPSGSGYMPGAPVTVTLHSDPVVLGSLLPDENGTISGTLPVPADAAVGQHTLVISGLSEDGEYIEKRIPVVVVLPAPLWVWAALAGTMLALIVAAVFAVIGLRRRRRLSARAS